MYYYGIHINFKEALDHFLFSHELTKKNNTRGIFRKKGKKIKKNKNRNRVLIIFI